MHILAHSSALAQLVALCLQRAHSVLAAMWRPGCMLANPMRDIQYGLPEPMPEPPEVPREWYKSRKRGQNRGLMHRCTVCKQCRTLYQWTSRCKTCQVMCCRLCFHVGECRLCSFRDETETSLLGHSLLKAMSTSIKLETSSI